MNGRVVDISDCCYEIDLASLQLQLSTRTVLEQVCILLCVYKMYTELKVNGQFTGIIHESAIIVCISYR